MAPLSKQKQRVKTEIKRFKKQLQKKPPPPPETCAKLEKMIADKYKKLELWKVCFIIYSPLPNYGGGAFIFFAIFFPKILFIKYPYFKKSDKIANPPPFLLSCPYFNILSI